MVKGVCVSREMTTAAAVGSTHPTVMLSCFVFFFWKICRNCMLVLPWCVSTSYSGESRMSPWAGRDNQILGLSQPKPID